MSTGTTTGPNIIQPPPQPVKVQIVPTDKLKTAGIYSSFTISSININPFNTAYINVMLFDEKEQFIQNTNISLTKEEYDKWGVDDSYITDIVAMRLGFTVMNVAAPTVPVTTTTPTVPVTTTISSGTPVTTTETVPVTTTETVPVTTTETAPVTTTETVPVTTTETATV